MRVTDAKVFPLKAQREARGINQYDAANILCASQSAVAKWESGQPMPAVYRRVWEYHWRLDDPATAVKPKAKRKPASVPTKQ